MINYFQGNPSVPADIGKITPNSLNIPLLKDVLEIMTPITEAILPPKRSGFSYAVFVLYQSIIQICGLSPHYVGNAMNQACINANFSFQNFTTIKFQNNKRRRFFPDQPGLSRCLKYLSDQNLTESFWNAVLFSNLLMLKELKIISQEISIIADYTKEPCMKNKADPYCFGTKEGKTVHKTLTFSIISNNLHQIIANYKIFKRQDKIPIFEEIHQKLQNNGFCIKYALLDRGFYQKKLLSLLKQWKITVIMPGRKCNQTKLKIQNYLKNKAKRYCKGYIKLNYVKGIGFPLLRFDLLLCAKRKHKLQDTKRNFKKGNLTLDEAAKQIFPLIVMFGSKKGIKSLHGNESYIRYLYKTRWLIEIAFREMNRLGITQKVQGRDVRLGIMGAKSLVYNFWQLQRFHFKREDLGSPELELIEFLGMTSNYRYRTLTSL